LGRHGRTWVSTKTGGFGRNMSENWEILKMRKPESQNDKEICKEDGMKLTIFLWVKIKDLGDHIV
jgi:hypothetical protein